MQTLHTKHGWSTTVLNVKDNIWERPKCSTFMSIIPLHKYSPALTYCTFCCVIWNSSGLLVISQLLTSIIIKWKECVTTATRRSHPPNVSDWVRKALAKFKGVNTYAIHCKWLNASDLTNSAHCDMYIFLFKLQFWAKDSSIFSHSMVRDALDRLVRHTYVIQ